MQEIIIFILIWKVSLRKIMILAYAMVKFHLETSFLVYDKSFLEFERVFGIYYIVTKFYIILKLKYIFFNISNLLNISGLILAYKRNQIWFVIFLFFKSIKVGIFDIFYISNFTFHSLCGVISYFWFKNFLKYISFCSIT